MLKAKRKEKDQNKRWLHTVENYMKAVGVRVRDV
jgi:hypothetical protein